MQILLDMVESPRHILEFSISFIEKHLKLLSFQ